jgi:ATP-binding cassette subfamily B protein
MGRRQKRTISESAPSVRDILVRFWPFIRKRRGLLTGATIALIGEVFLRLLEPWPLKFVFDRVIVPPERMGSTGVPALDAMSPMALLTVSAGIVVALAAIRGVVGYLHRVGFALAGNKVLAECRSELFVHLQRLSLSYHNRKRTGDLVMRVTGDIGRLKEVTTTAIMPLFAHFLTLVGMFAVMFFMNWRLALIAVAILPFFLLATRRISKRIRGVAREQRERKGEIGATAVEAIGSVGIVQALSLEDLHARTFAARNRADLREGVRAKRLSARLVGLTDLLVACATAGVLWFGARMAIDGALTAGDLIVFLAYLRNALRPIQNVSKYVGRISKAAASAERIVDVLSTTPTIADRPGAVEAPDTIDSVRFDGVTFGYEPGKVTVADLSIEARQGDVIVLAGPSGAGKSTVVNLLLRLYDPDTGSISVNGRDIRDCTVASLRRRVAVVPQDNVLFAVSVRDNIAYGAPGATDEEIVAAATLARAHDFIMELEHGYDTVLGDRGGTLSEGQRQRIAIARAAIRRAPILVLDEPTSSLDNENTRLVRKALRDLSRDRITFVVAHDLSTVRDEYRVVFLDRGRIAEEGTQRELLERGGRYAALFAIERGMARGPDEPGSDDRAGDGGAGAPRRPRDAGERERARARRA